MPCFCGALDCYQCYPQNFQRNEFGRLVYVGDDDEEKIEEEDDNGDIEDSTIESEDN
jgi:hypothetical protein